MQQDIIFNEEQKILQSIKNINQSYNQDKQNLQQQKLYHPIKIVHKQHSPYFNQYSNKFIKNRKAKYYLDYWQNFISYDIVAFSQTNNKFQSKLQIVYLSKNYKIIHYEFQLSYFIIKVKILNITNDDKFSFYFDSQIDSGAFGTVHQVNQMNQTFAIKQIKINKQFRTSVQQSIKQYAIMKLMAALQCGPPLHKTFGFDLVVNQKSIYFSSEKCISFSNFIQNFNSQEMFNSKFQQLQMSLLMMHYLSICHCDIKPLNIMYSPSLNKLVFIDFGFSEFVQLKVGFMKEQKAKGSFFYMCQDMQNVFISAQKKGLVDKYYNDYYGLLKTKQTVLSMFISKDQYTDYERKIIKYIQQGFAIEQVQNNIFPGYNFLLNQSLSHSQSSINHNQITEKQQKLHEVQSDFLTVYVCFLLSEFKVNQLQILLDSNKEYYDKIDRKFSKIYWVFLEINQILNIQSTYKKFKEIMIKNIILSYNTRFIIENILDPYFQNQTSEKLQKNESYQIYKKQQQITRQIINNRYTKIQQIIENKKSHLLKQLNQKQKYFFKYNISKELLTKEHQSTEQVLLQNIIIKLKSPQLTAVQKIQIKSQFFKLSQAKRYQILNTINTQLSYCNNKITDISQDILVMKNFFQKSNIFFQDQQFYMEHSNHQSYFTMYLNIFIQTVFQFIQLFDIQKHILYIANKYYSSQIQQYMSSFFYKSLLSLLQLTIALLLHIFVSIRQLYLVVLYDAYKSLYNINKQIRQILIMIKNNII